MSDRAQETNAQSVCFRQFQQPRAVDEADVTRLFIKNGEISIVRRERHVFMPKSKSALTPGINGTKVPIDVNDADEPSSEPWDSDADGFL